MVEDQGRVHLDGVPFAPGTEVEVTIREKATEPRLDQPRVRMKDLFARVQARNTEPIGPLRREELYDRKILR
jgi:hypothetical protein